MAEGGSSSIGRWSDTARPCIYEFGMRTVTGELLSNKKVVKERNQPS